MRLSQRLGRIPALLFFAGWTSAFAQQTQTTPAIDQILLRVEANADSYKASVPSFVCDEHITSQEIRDGKVKHETTVDAVFSVARSRTQAGLLDESRDIKRIDGKPTSSNKAKMPLSFSGGFGGALTKFLSTDRRACFDYQQVSSTGAALGTASFTFAASDAALQQPACAGILHGTTGSFVVDLASMQVTHIERTVSQPVQKNQNALGTAAIDYSAVMLNSRTFWLPAMITASTAQTPKTNGARFTAYYSNYHRYTSTSTIVPTTQDSNTQSPSNQ